MLSPKILKEQDYDKVNKILIEFYTNRPVEYGILERPKEVYEKYAKFIWDLLQNKNRKILDLGSGSWRIPNEIAKYGFDEVYGLDYFSEEEFKANLSKFTHTNAKLAKYEEPGVFPFPNCYFDAVSSLCVLEHIIFVENFLNEIDRVLKPGGLAIIQCPNWSGINHFVMGILHILLRRDRFWQLRNVKDAFFGIFRSFYWYLINLISKKPKFILIYPRMENGKVKFERSDDDAVHLCQPLSIKKFFKKKGYKVIFYNRGFGTTPYTYVFNWFFPSLSTTNVLVFQKKRKN